MVVQPIPPPDLPGEPGAPIWPVIEATQLARTNDCWMITQDAHARLSGEIAAAFGTPWAPRPPDDVVEAIALHDSGWTAVENELEARARQEGKRPPSFIAVAVPDFLRAWVGSIDCAAGCSALAGILVSAHFSSIGQIRLRQAADPPEIQACLQAFEARESQRRQALASQQSHSPAELAALLELLQFCDLASLYICGGARLEVEFPQRVGGRTIRLAAVGDDFVFAPSPLLAPLKLRLPATHWPGGNTRQDMAVTLR